MPDAEKSQLAWLTIRITQFPRLRSLAAELAAYDGAAELDEGLAILLAVTRQRRKVSAYSAPSPTAA
ncbi:hypothetical protein [Pseudonocardia sp. NPDC049154]|uniref:hypothetical protein n=1 Tax=Pseudonocardia sp. NPDC049154 TaxID=3155501 RepID=UPI0033E518B9